MSSTAKVGLFALIVLFIAAMFILRIEDITLGAGKVQRIRVTFPDVSGLDAKAAVRVYGVRVGKVERILLLQDRAEVLLAVDASLKLGKGATAAVRNMGLLGDKYVELMPGNPALGPPENPAMLTGTSPISYDEILAKINAVGENVQALTSAFRTSLTGPEAESKMKEIVENIRSLTAEANLLILENRGTVKTIAGNVQEITARLKADLPEVLASAKALLENLDTVVLDNRTGLAETVRNLKESTAKLETTMQSVDSIVEKIDKGQGTIGKLINSPETHDKLVSAMDSIKGGADSLSNSLGRVQRWGMNLGFESIYLHEITDVRSKFSIQLVPGRDRFYLLEVVSDPVGKRSEKTTTLTTTGPDGTITTTTAHELKYDQAFTVTAQYAWRTDPWILRIGIRQNQGGVGLDSLWLKERLWLSADAWDFSRPEDKFRLMFQGRYYITKGFYLSAGFDDVLLKDRRSVFVGSGITWQDEDFKYLIGAAPKL